MKNKKMTEKELKKLLEDLPDGEIHVIEFMTDDKDGEGDEI